jgi:hypothetical protein
MGLLESNQEHADSTVPGFVPWHERCTSAERIEGIKRLERALCFCRGRAADLAPHLREHIKRLQRAVGIPDGHRGIS